MVLRTITRKLFHRPTGYEFDVDEAWDRLVERDRRTLADDRPAPRYCPACTHRQDTGTIKHYAACPYATAADVYVDPGVGGAHDHHDDDRTSTAADDDYHDPGLATPGSTIYDFDR
jgi:hypothetical protein